MGIVYLSVYWTPAESVSGDHIDVLLVYVQNSKEQKLLLQQQQQHHHAVSGQVSDETQANIRLDPRSFRLSLLSFSFSRGHAFRIVSKHFRLLAPGGSMQNYSDRRLLPSSTAIRGSQTFVACTHVVTQRRLHASPLNVRTQRIIATGKIIIQLCARAQGSSG